MAGEAHLAVEVQEAAKQPTEAQALGRHDLLLRDRKRRSSRRRRNDEVGGSGAEEEDDGCGADEEDGGGYADEEDGGGCADEEDSGGGDTCDQACGRGAAEDAALRYRHALFLLYQSRVGLCFLPPWMCIHLGSRTCGDDRKGGDQVGRKGRWREVSGAGRKEGKF